MNFTFDALQAVAFAVIALFSLVVLLSFVVVGHHIVTDRERRRNRERFESAAVLLAPHLVANSAELESAVEAARRKNGDQAVALVLRRARYDLSSPVNVRITAILEAMGEVEHLLRQFASRRDWKRTIAIRGLGECGGTRALGALTIAADDVSSEVRRAARDGLISDGSKRAIHVAIASFIRDLPRRSGWRRSFYARLAVIGADELTALVRSGQLASGEEKLAIEALGDAGRPSALALALERINSPEGEIRATAVRVLGKVGRDPELTLVFDALKDKEWFVRAAAARSLEWILTLHGRSTHLTLQYGAADRLGNCLTDSSWWVRANAARALSRIGEPGLAVLMRTVENPDRYARDAAIAALAMTPLSSAARLSIKKKVDTVMEAAARPRTQPGLPAEGGIA
jgi:HEAT repeat protein